MRTALVGALPVEGQPDQAGIAGDWYLLEQAITRQDNLRPRGSGGGRTWGLLLDDKRDMTDADVEHLLDWIRARPDRPKASRVAADIRATLWRHVRDLIETHSGLTVRDTVPAWCRLLADHVDELRKEPDAHLLADDVATCHRALLAAIDYPDDRARIATGRPCPETIDDPDGPNHGEPCGGELVAVIPEDETPHIDCPGCGRTWTPQQWDALIRRVEKREALIAGQIARTKHVTTDQQVHAYLTPPPRLGTISVLDASAIYGVPAKTLYRWVSEGRLTNCAPAVLRGLVVTLDPHQVAAEARRSGRHVTDTPAV